MKISMLLRHAALASVGIAVLSASSQAQTIGCVTGGGSTLIPTSGTGGGGAYPVTLPPFPGTATLNVAAIPPGATVVTEVKIRGLTHTYVFDLQFVLQSPSGAVHNLWTRPNSAGGVVFSCDFGGDYTLVPPSGCAQSYPGACTSPTIFAPGVYAQDFGTYPSGNSNIFNTPLDTIPAATGTWTLLIYDWAGADVGSINTWELCFGTAGGGAAPGFAPVPISPANGASAAAPVTLTWSVLNCATSYDLDLDGVVTTGIAGTSQVVSPSTGLHSWRVRAVNAGGAGPWSSFSNFDVPPPPPPSTCIPGGVGGFIPSTGTGGGGTWPTVLPPNPFISTYNAAPPAGSTQIVKVELNGLSHTWIGDLQIVLTDPSGGQHNLMYRPGSAANSLGLNCDFDGTNYVFYQSGQLALPTTSCPGGSFPGGSYNQHFGDWNSGDANVFNTPLGTIPVSAGNWTLSIYDWAGGDTGSLTDWQICFAGPSSPPTFCTPINTGSSSGCIPTIAATGNPNVSHSNNCVITVSDVEGQRSGLLFYGIMGQVNFPWCPTNSNSFFCVKSPVQRLFPQASGGAAGQCNGQLTNDWNNFQNTFAGALGNPFSVGDMVEVQGWFRDPPACKTTFLSEGLTLTYIP